MAKSINIDEFYIDDVLADHAKAVKKEAKKDKKKGDDEEKNKDKDKKKKGKKKKKKKHSQTVSAPSEDDGDGYSDGDTSVDKQTEKVVRDLIKKNKHVVSDKERDGKSGGRLIVEIG